MPDVQSIMYWKGVKVLMRIYEILILTLYLLLTLTFKSTLYLYCSLNAVVVYGINTTSYLIST